MYLLIKYIKSVLWRVAKRLFCIQDARFLKIKANSVKKQRIKFFVISLETRDKFNDTVRGKQEQVCSQEKYSFLLNYYS